MSLWENRLTFLSLLLLCYSTTVHCTVYIVLYITLVLYLLNLLLKKGKREGGKGEEGRSGRGEGGGGEMVAKLTYPLVRAKSFMAT